MNKQREALKFIRDLAYEELEHPQQPGVEVALRHIMRKASEALGAVADHMYDDVALFHGKFNIPIASDARPCRIPSYDVIEYRTKFLEEELTEFRTACDEGSLVDAFDALLDIAWVAMGTAHYFGAPWEEGWAEVVRANMDCVLVTRENCPPEKRYRKDMVMKPEGWKPPDLLRVIRDHNMKVKRNDKLLDIPQFLRQEVEEPPGGVIGAGLDLDLTPVDDKEISELGENMSPEFHSFNCACEICIPGDETNEMKGE